MRSQNRLDADRTAFAVAAIPSAGPGPSDEPREMSSVGIRELAQHVSCIVSRVVASGHPTLVTKHGSPVAAIVPIDPGHLEPLILARAAKFLEDLAGPDGHGPGSADAAEVFSHQLARLAELLGGPASPPPPASAGAQLVALNPVRELAGSGRPIS